MHGSLGRKINQFRNAACDAFFHHKLEVVMMLLKMVILATAYANLKGIVWITTEHGKVDTQRSFESGE